MKHCAHFDAHPSGRCNFDLGKCDDPQRSCAPLQTCDRCISVQDDTCGWCRTRSLCLAGTNSGPLYDQECAPDEWEVLSCTESKTSLSFSSSSSIGTRTVNFNAMRRLNDFNQNSSTAGSSSTQEWHAGEVLLLEWEGGEDQVLG